MLHTGAESGANQGSADASEKHKTEYVSRCIESLRAVSILVDEVRSCEALKRGDNGDCDRCYYQTVGG